MMQMWTNAGKTCTPVLSGVRTLLVVSAVRVHVDISYQRTANTAKVTQKQSLPPIFSRKVVF